MLISDTHMPFSRQPAQAHQNQFSWLFNVSDKLVKGGGFFLIQVLPYFPCRNTDVGQHELLLWVRLSFKNSIRYCRVYQIFSVGSGHWELKKEGLRRDKLDHGHLNRKLFELGKPLNCSLINDNVDSLDVRKIQIGRNHLF